MKLFRKSIIELRSHAFKFGILVCVICSSFTISYSQDEDAITCSDGLDNDFDGLADLEDDSCILSSNPACSDCPDGISFADELLEYSGGCGNTDPNPEGALGVCDWNDTGADSPSHVYLGNDGFIRLRFNNNFLMNSGDNSPDLRIIQAGVDLEFHLSLRPFDEFTETALQNSGFVSANSDGFYEVQTLGLFTSDLDIDAVLPGYAYAELRFDAVEVRDAGNGCAAVNGVPGVRIDAVCAMTSVFYSPPFECDGSVYLFQNFFTAGMYLLDLENETSVFLTDELLVSDNTTGYSLGSANGFGYNPVDNKIWGYYGNKESIIRINANYKVDTIVHLPISDVDLFGAGDFSPTGLLLLYADEADSIFQVDLNPNSDTYLTLVSAFPTTPSETIDFSFNPIDLKYYGVSNDHNLVTYTPDGDYVVLGAVTGDGITEVSGFGASFFDDDGNLYVQNNYEGKIFRVDDVSSGMTEAVFLFTGPNTLDNDAARCTANLPFDCNFEVEGTAILDECGVCLEPDDPNFNLSCTDCAGIVNGTSIIDDCGECLAPASPEFNQSCADCAGVPNGTSIIDECGECFELTDPEFNQSCADCLGMPNGTFVLDECGECLEPDDPNFNLSCTDCAGVINGFSEIDQCGECLEPTSPEFNQSCADCAGVPNGLSVLDECGVCLLPDDASFNLSCTDCEGVINGSSLIDECGECLLPNDPNFNQSCADCAGVPNGQNLIDLCGECWPEASPFFNACVDCNGTVFGDWFLNVCNICTSPEEEDPDLVCFGNLVFIPNSFTPDTDGLNDVFKPTFYIQPDDYSFSIFNRYGELIFTSSEHNIGWDGSVRNGDYYAPNGVYSFVVTYKGFNSTDVNIRRGHVSLIR